MTTTEQIKEINPSAQIRYTLDSKDNIRLWACWYGYNGLKAGIFYTDAQEGGKIKTPTFKEALPKNIGKANYMSAEAQAEAMQEQEIGKKERSNYFLTPELARSSKMWLPMLAHKFNEYGSKIPFPRYCQPKLDGARCNVYWSEAEQRVVAKTRTGKDYYTANHIIKELEGICVANKNLIFDGELYNMLYKHDFEKIMSLARQTKPTILDLKEASELLEYHIYDVYFKNDIDMQFSHRISWLRDCFSQYSFNMIKFVSSILNIDSENEDLLHDKYLEEGYEGQMIRHGGSSYKVNGRSQDLLKRKIFTDAEFEIVDVVEGEANWKGAAKKIIIRLPDGRTQGTSIDGSYEINKERYEKRKDIIGKLATVRYFRYTKDGLLYIPVVKDINRHD